MKLNEKFSVTLKIVISVSYVLDEEIFILMICNYLSHQSSQNRFFMNKLEVNKHVMY